MARKKTLRVLAIAIVVLLFAGLSSAASVTYSSSTTLCGDVTDGSGNLYEEIVIESGATISVCSSGKLNLTAVNKVVVNGTIDANYVGDSGGSSGYASSSGYGSDTGSGNSGSGTGSGGGGDGYASCYDFRAGGGGGGGYGASGGSGGAYNPGAGGSAYGGKSSMQYLVGSGGGGGGAATCENAEANPSNDGEGASGGGAVWIEADQISVEGTITADGENGVDGASYSYSEPYYAEAAGGGGGSGGSILLHGDTVELTGATLSAEGGMGGNSDCIASQSCGQGGAGGGGSGGRIKVFYYTLQNSSLTYSLSGGAGGTDDSGDDDGSPGSTGTYYTENSNSAPLKPSLEYPNDGDSGLEGSVELKVKVEDPNGQSMDVTFYNALNGNQIGSTQTGVNDGQNATVTWTGLEDGKQYYWYAVADDGSLTNQSETWAFSLSEGPSYLEYKDERFNIGGNGGQGQFLYRSEWYWLDNGWDRVYNDCQYCDVVDVSSDIYGYAPTGLFNESGNWWIIERTGELHKYDSSWNYLGNPVNLSYKGSYAENIWKRNGDWYLNTRGSSSSYVNVYRENWTKNYDDSYELSNSENDLGGMTWNDNRDEWWFTSEDGDKIFRYGIDFGYLESIEMIGLPDGVSDNPVGLDARGGKVYLASEWIEAQDPYAAVFGPINGTNVTTSTLKSVSDSGSALDQKYRRDLAARIDLNESSWSPSDQVKLNYTLYNLDEYGDFNSQGYYDQIESNQVSTRRSIVRANEGYIYKNLDERLGGGETRDGEFTINSPNSGWGLWNLQMFTGLRDVFSDSFEDGSILADDWIGDTGSYQYSSTQVFRGSQALESTTTGGGSKNIKRNLSVKATPESMTIAVRSQDEAGRFRWKKNGTTVISVTLDLYRSYLKAGDTFLKGDYSVGGSAVSADTWYFVEMKGINWSSGKIDSVKVNGAQEAKDVGFNNPADGFNGFRVNHFGASTGTSFFWDVATSARSSMTVSNNFLESGIISRSSTGGSCRYSTDCRQGLFCADTNGDATPDTCRSSASSYAGNVCERIGSGAKERISNSGKCKIAGKDMENRNMPSGAKCETSADCTTNYCYDGNDNGDKTCQTSPAAGDNAGDAAGVASGEADTCYFAGEIYADGASVDLFSDGVSNECVNGKWNQSVKATIDFSDVQEGNSLTIDYNVYNFREGFQYSNGYVDRLETNNVNLEQIRIGVSGESFEKSISGQIEGGRNETGSVSISVPNIDHTDDLQANTYLEYNVDGGSTRTIVGTPLTGGDFSEDRTSGSCRKGYQVGGTYYCVYSSQEEPYSAGSVVSSSSSTGDLCETRTSDNIEKRVTPSGSCKPAHATAENNNLPNGYRCQTKEDCINNYCYDSNGDGTKTCKGSPASGTATGEKASPQSGTDDSCYYAGQLYSAGSTITAFGESATCTNGRLKFDEDLAMEADYEDDMFQDTESVSFKFHNLNDYCSYSGPNCFVKEDKIVSLDNVTFSIKDHEPKTYELNQDIEGQKNYSASINVNFPEFNYTDSAHVTAVVKYNIAGETRKKSTPIVTRGETWKQLTPGASCVAGYETDEGYFCEFDGADTLTSGSGVVSGSSTDTGAICKTGGSSSMQRVTPSGACEIAGAGVENQNVPLGNRCELQSDCINNYCWDSNNDSIMTCQDSQTTGSETGVNISAKGDCAASACSLQEQCYADGATVNFQDQQFVCNSGLLVENVSANNEVLTDAIKAEYRNDIAVEIDVNDTGYGALDPVEVTYMLLNTHEYGDFDEATGYLTRDDSRQVSTWRSVLEANGEPQYFHENRNLYGGEKRYGGIEFKTPESYFNTWNLQGLVQYDYQGKIYQAASNNILQDGAISRSSAGGSCRYVTDCQQGLFCADTNGDATPDTCKADADNDAGNVCEKIGSGAKERINTTGKCEVAYPDMENRNIPDGNQCETNADCLSSYCYDHDSDGTKTCQDTDSAGTSAGLQSGAMSGDPDTCYFAGKVYEPGASQDWFGDGVSNECVNGKWNQSVKATIDFSDVKEGETLNINFNVYNFHNGFTYSNGYISRLNSNNIELQKLRVEVSGKVYEKSISGTVEGRRNETGSVSINVPKINHTDDLQANTYLEYDYQGSTKTIVARPLFGGQFSEDRTSGLCRKGYQVDDTYYCVYSSQEEPYARGDVVSSSNDVGNLCETRTVGNVEKRVTPEGSCEPAGLRTENNNLPNGYRCQTKEDCINNYCYDSNGDGTKTCQSSSPTTGSASGTAASPQSGDDNACYYAGKVYSDGATETVHGKSASCVNGEWSFQDDLAFDIDIDSGMLSGTETVSMEFHNFNNNCEYTVGDPCRVIEENIVHLKNVTFSVKDHEPKTYSLGESIEGEKDYSTTVNVDIPDFNYTRSSRLKTVLKYERNGSVHKLVTPYIFRGQTWKQKTSGSCVAGFETDKGYFCRFDGADELVSGTGNVTSSSADTGALCKEGGAATRQRVTPSGACKLTGPGVENQNVPLGNECELQGDCINNYCWDGDNDTVMSCEDSQTAGSETGVKISDRTDCAPQACVENNQCYANGATVSYQDQTYICNDGKLEENVTTPQKKEDRTNDIQSELRELAYGVTPNTTNFNAGEEVRFDFKVRNLRKYCSESENTGLCTRIEANDFKTKEVRSRVEENITYHSSVIRLYGAERKTGSFTRKMPSSPGKFDFSSVLMFNITNSNDVNDVSSRPYSDNVTKRSGAGESCRYAVDCKRGLFCADIDGNDIPDTCRSSASNYEGLICEQYGSGTQERITESGACEFASPGFENKNIPEGNECRTTDDCVTDYCYDGNSDGTKTCQTSPTSGTNAGLESTADSCGTNSCFYGGKCYSSGTEKDINTDSTTAVCENGVWQDKIEFNAKVPYGFSDGQSITIDYNVHNPRQCDRSEGFCMKDSGRSVDLQKIVVNVAGREMEKSVSGNVLPERNTSGSITVNVPEIYHTGILNARVFLHYKDSSDGTDQVVTTRPAVRGDVFEERSSGSCMAGYLVEDSSFCLYDTQESPSSPGEVVGSGSVKGDLCAVSQATESEYRVTPSGSCQPAAEGFENKNLPEGYECNTELDCVTDYCYDSSGDGTKTCETTPTNGTSTGTPAAKQSCSANACHYGGQCFSEGSSATVFGKSATCESGRWSYSENIGFKAEIPDEIEPGTTIDMNYSFYNPYHYCDYDGKECEVITQNIVNIENATIEFRNDNVTVPLSGSIEGGKRYDGSTSVNVPDFRFTENIPVTVRVKFSREGTVYTQKAKEVVRGEDWENRTIGQCRGGLDAASNYYCFWDNTGGVEYGKGTVRTFTERAGSVCETPQITTQMERVTTGGECAPSQPGAQNNNQPLGYQCQNQADCVNSYCYDSDNDSIMTCHKERSTGSETGQEISETTDCGTNSCAVQDQCYADGSNFTYNGQQRFCVDGNVEDEKPELGSTNASDILAEYRGFGYRVVSESIGPDTLEVTFEFENNAADPVKLTDTYMVAGTGVEKEAVEGVDLNSGGTRQFTINSSRPMTGTKLFYSESRAFNGSIGIDQWKTSNTTCYNAETGGFQDSCIEAGPDIEFVEFVDYSNEHKFNVSFTGYDPDGASDVTSCRITVDDGESSQTYSGDIITSYGDSEALKCNYSNINSSISGIEPEEELDITLELEDSTGRTESELHNHSVPNRPPQHDKPTITPEPAFSGDTLTLNSQGVSDPEGDSISYNYSWRVNGELLPYHGDELEPGNYTSPDYVIGYVTPKDPYEAGQTKSTELQIQRTALDITGLEFANASNAHSFNASVTINATDPDGVSCQANVTDGESTHIVEGDRDLSYGGNNQLRCTVSGIESSLSGFEPTELIDVNITAEDINDAEDFAVGQNVIPNRVPSVTEPTIDPSSPRAIETVTGVPGTVTDAEGDSVTFNYSWYVNGVETGYTGTTLLEGNFSQEDNVTFETVPYDGYEYGAANSTKVVVQDETVWVDNLTFEDYAESERFNVSANLNAVDVSQVGVCQVYAADNDGDSFVFDAMIDSSYRGEHEAKCSYSNINSSLSGFFGGDLLDVTINATDGETLANETGEHMIPVKLKVGDIMFQNYSTEHAFNLSAVVNSSDQSYINSCSIEASDGNGNSFTASGNLNKGYGTDMQAECSYSKIDNAISGFEVLENIKVNVTADSENDTDYSIGYNNIPNEAPVFESVFTDPSNLDDQSNVKLKANVTDQNRDTVRQVNFTITHENGTVLVDDSNGTLENGYWTSQEFNVEPKDRYDYEINASDPYESHTASGSFTATNKPPKITSITKNNATGVHGVAPEWIVEDMNGDEDIQSCSIEATDGDGNSMSATGSLDRSYGGQKEAKCLYISVNSTTSGFEVNEQIELNLTVTDEISQSQSNTTNDILPNRAPQVSLEMPVENGSSGNPVEFKWNTSDVDNDTIESRLVVANNSDMTDVKLNTTLTGTSYEESFGPETYYWRVIADDSYTEVESGKQEFIIPKDLENVSLTLKGDYGSVIAGDEERDIAEGTTQVYDEMDYPYIAMENESVVEGIVPIGGFKRITYRNTTSHDEISVRKGINGERFVLPANTGNHEDIERREQLITTGRFFEVSRPSFSKEIPKESTISVLLSRDQVNLTGDEGAVELEDSLDLTVRKKKEDNETIEMEVIIQ